MTLPAAPTPAAFEFSLYLLSTLTLRFDLRGSSLISTHLFKVLNLLREEETVVRLEVSFNNNITQTYCVTLSSFIIIIQHITLSANEDQEEN